MKQVKPGERYLLLIGTLFWAGCLPKAPGTWGSFLFLPFIFVSYQLFGYYGMIPLTVIVAILSLVAAPAAIKHFGNDPGEFVMDECAGQALVFTIALPLLNRGFDLIILTLGFLLFRLFDITKPLGIKRAEKLHGKYGILFDDLLAGFYASLSLVFLIYLYSHI